MVETAETTTEIHVTLEQMRLENANALERQRGRLEVIRLAKETLIENARNNPVGEAGVTAAEITAFAQELNIYVND
jgi:hypothetical protein